MEAKIYFQLVLYILGIISLIAVIVLEVKLFSLEQKVDKVLDHLEREVNHFNEAFTKISNKFNITKNISAFISKIFLKRT
ncbi:MAG: hypothetical protein E7158_03395 [Firmicutes bacterium]|nr:hypothetical protein [Bacillota bacterium]